MSEAAKNYKQLASAKRQEETVHDVTLPSGAVWKMADPPIQRFIATGKLPQGLVTKMTAIAKRTGGDPGETGKEMLKNLSPEDMVSTLFFVRDLLQYCARDPKISTETPTPDDAIAPEEIIPEDFEFLSNWVLSGGNAGSGLGTFRRE